MSCFGNGIWRGLELVFSSDQRLILLADHDIFNAPCRQSQSASWIFDCIGESGAPYTARRFPGSRSCFVSPLFHSLYSSHFRQLYSGLYGLIDELRRLSTLKQTRSLPFRSVWRAMKRNSTAAETPSVMTDRTRSCNVWFSGKWAWLMAKLHLFSIMIARCIFCFLMQSVS